MTEETPGFSESDEPDVPSGATSDDAEPKAAPSPDKGEGRPRPGTQQQEPLRRFRT